MSVRVAIVAFDVLLAERALPQDVVPADDGGGEAGNAGLRPQRLDILAEAVEQQFFGVRRCTDEQQGCDDQDTDGAAHRTVGG